MKRRGIINAPLSGALARLGHTQTVVIADCGLPLPAGVAVVDLAVRFGLPGFFDVLDAVLDEIVVESATVAGEVRAANPGCWEGLRARLQTVELVTHDELKARLQGVQLVVRTGEATPFANVILHCGVPF